jgi:hypothetical protein
MTKTRAEKKAYAEEESFKSTIFSHLHAGFPPRIVSTDDATYITGLLTDNKSCTVVATLVEEDQVTDTGVVSAALTDADVVALFGDRVSTRGLDNLSRIMDASQQSLDQVCFGEMEEYVTLFDGGGTVVTLGTYNVDGEYWNLSQPVTATIGGAVQFFPDALRIGTPVLMTSFGDAGVSTWKYWVPTTLGTMQLVESCTLEIKEPLSSAETPENTLSCELVYVE